MKSKMKVIKSDKKKAIIEYDGIEFIVYRKNVEDGLPNIGFFKKGKVSHTLYRESYHGKNILAGIYRKKIRSQFTWWIIKQYYTMMSWYCDWKGHKGSISLNDGKAIHKCSRCRKEKTYTNEKDIQKILSGRMG